MATLQQSSLVNVTGIALPLYQLASSTSDASPPPSACTVLAFHRRTSSLLLASPSLTVAGSIAFTTVRRDADRGGWVSTCTRPWSCPPSMIPVIAALPLESMDAFLLVATNRKTSKAMLHILTIHGSLFCVCSLSEASTFIACADFDQNRKDLLVALDGGRVQSYALRLVTEGRGENKISAVQPIFRRQIQLSKEAGRTPIQLASGDVSGTALVLSIGGITSLDSGSLDKLWFIPANTFVMPPTQLWMDRFGSDFIVLCRGSQGRETLEFWTAPTTFALAEANSFSRVVVPTPTGSQDAAVVDVAFETVGGRHGTMLCALYSNARVQLWRPLRTQGELMLDCDITLLGRFDLTNYTVSSRAVPIGPDTTGTTHAPGTPMLRRNPLPSRSTMQFTASVGTPDCPLSLLCVCNSDILTMSIHAPRAVDAACQRSVLDLMLMQHPGAHRHDWDEESEEDVITRFQLAPLAEADKYGRYLDDQHEGPLTKFGTSSPSPSESNQPSPHAPTGPRYIAAGNAVYKLDDEDDEFDSIAEQIERRPADFGPPMGSMSVDSPHNVELRLPVVEGRAMTPSTRHPSPLAMSATGTPRSHGSTSPLLRGSTSYLSVKPNLEEYSSSIEKDQADNSQGPQTSEMPDLAQGREASLADFFRQNTDSLLAPISPVAATHSTTVIRVENTIHIQENDLDDVSLGSRNSMMRPTARAFGAADTSGFDEPNSQVAFQSSFALQSSVQTGSFAGLDSQTWQTAQISINLPTSSLNTTSNILLDIVKETADNYNFAPLPRPSKPIPSDSLEKPAVTLFIPARILPSLSAGGTDLPDLADGLSLLRLVTPSLVVLNHTLGLEQNKNAAKSVVSSRAPTVKSSTTMAFLTRNGLQPSSRDVELAKTLSLNLAGVASRSGSLAVMTPLKEAFMFDLRHVKKSSSAGTVGSLRLEFDMRQGCVATVMTMADVNVFVHRVVQEVRVQPSRMSGKGAAASKTQAALANVNHEETLASICLVGDSDGKVHFAVGSVARGSLQCGSIAAHASQIRCIMVTADASRPLWRVGCAVQRSTTFGHTTSDTYTPHACPGSAIVTVAVDGEVKVWQPVFVGSTTAAVRSDQVFTSSRLEWRLAGLFSSQRAPFINGIRTPSSSVTSAVMDPSCMFLLLCRSDGSMEQWPVPGLISGGNSSLQTTQTSLWSSSRHRGPITDALVFVQSADSSMKVIDVPRDVDGDGIDVALSSKIVCSVRPVAQNAAAGLEKSPTTDRTVGYTLEELRVLAGSASLCTSSADSSVVLWRFVVSQDGADWSASSRFTSSHNSRYLYPFPCRRFVYSSPPAKGLCFPPLAPTAASEAALQECVWRVGAIVNGIVVTAMQAPFATLFATDTNMLENMTYAATGKVMITTTTSTRIENSIAVSESLQLMPVMAKVFKPSRTAELLSQRLRISSDGAKGGVPYSWQGLDHWQERVGDPVPPRPRLDPDYEEDALAFSEDSAASTQGQMTLSDGPAFPGSLPSKAQPTVSSNNLVVPLNPELPPPQEGQERLLKVSMGGVRVVVPAKGDNLAPAATWFDEGQFGTLGARELEAAMQPDASGAKRRFLASRDGKHVEERQEGGALDQILEGSQVETLASSIDIFPSLIMNNMSQIPAAPAPTPRTLESLTDDLGADELTADNDAANLGTPGRSPASVRSARSQGVAMPGLDNVGIIGFKPMSTGDSPRQLINSSDPLGFGMRSIEIPIDDGQGKLRLRRVQGTDGAVSSELVMSSLTVSNEKADATGPVDAIQMPFPIVTDIITTEEVTAEGPITDALTADPWEDEEGDDQRVLMKPSKVAKIVVVKKTLGQSLREEKQKLLKDRMQAAEKSKLGKSKTLYVSKSSKDLKEEGKEKPIARQVMGSSQPFAMPLNFSDNAIRQKGNKNVVDKGTSKARSRLQNPPTSPSNELPGEEKLVVPNQGAVEEVDELQGDDFYQDPEYHIPNVTAPPPQPVQRSRRISTIGIVLQDPIATEGDLGEVQAVLQEGDFLSDVPTYFDRNSGKTFIYDRKDNARPAKHTYVPKLVKPGTAGSRPGTEPLQPTSAEAEEGELKDLFGANFETAALSNADKEAVAVVLNEFSFADLDVFEGLDAESKLQVLREMNQEGEPEPNQSPAEQAAAAAKRGVMAMKRLLMRQKVLKTLGGSIGSKDGSKSGLAKSGPGAPLPEPDVVMEVLSYTQKTIKLKYFVGNTQARIVIFAMLADYDAPLPDPPTIEPPIEIASGSVASAISNASDGTSVAYSIKSNGSRPASKLPSPSKLEKITQDDLLLLPGVCACFVKHLPDDDSDPPPTTAVTTGAKVSIPSVKVDENSVASGSVAGGLPSHPNTPAVVPQAVEIVIPDEPNQATLLNLDPEKSYKIYAYVACTATGKRSFRQMATDEVLDTVVPVTTLAEVLEIDWSSLSDEQRLAEIKAASRSFNVMKAAASEKIPVFLPSDNDLELIAKGDNTSTSGRSLQKKYATFLQWWAPNDASFVSKTREAFLCHECLFYCRPHPEGEPEASVLQTFRATNILTAPEIAALTEWASTTALAPDYIFPTGKGSSEKLTPVERVFRRFRSWYCGGYELQDYEKRQWESQAQSYLAPASGEGFENALAIGARPGAAGGDTGLGGGFGSLEGTSQSPTESRIPSAKGDLAVAAGDANAETAEGGVIGGFAFEAMTDELQSAEVGPPGFAIDGELAMPPPQFTPIMASQRIEDRTASLQQRRQHVENACALVVGLIEQHKQADKKGVSEKDLTLRRALLMQADLELIMASTKLLDLLLAQKLLKPGARPDVSKLGLKGEMSPAAICAADIFSIVGPETLTPAPPPALLLATLPGTSRRPIRAWQLCSEEEKLTEITLAVSLDKILALAIEDGVCVPDPEDIELDKALVPLRHKRVQDFIAWYAGDEGKNKIPGLGIPTLARVIFAETLEGAAVESDPFVVQTMLSEKLPLPDNVMEQFHARAELEKMCLASPDGRICRPPTPPPVEDGGEIPPVKHAPQTEEQTQLLKTAFNRDAADSLRAFYENSLATVTGLSIRLTLIRRYIDAVITGRRQLMLKYLWPPGPARLSHMMMFPPGGLMLPPYELPPFRFRPLFPSRDRETAYTHKEMEQWYTPQELDEDDLLMQEAEEDGRRRAVYLEWLAQEKERQIITREDMLNEDRLGQQRRAYFDLVQERLRKIESLQPIPEKNDFIFEAALPGSYEYIKEDTLEYKHGDGLQNEDELEDLRIEQARKAEEARKKEEERRKRVEEERLRRIAEDEAAQRREELNRRLAEGIEARRLVREHLAAVKQQRRIAAVEKERQAREEEIAAAAEAAKREVRKAGNDWELHEAKSLIRERLEMEEQDFFCHEFYISSAECARMEHEDILSSMRDVNDARRAKEMAEKRAFLEEVYAPFEPFQFHRDKLRLPTLHSVLSSYPLEAEGYDNLSKERLFGANNVYTGGSMTISASQSLLGQDMGSGIGLGIGSGVGEGLGQLASVESIGQFSPGNGSPFRPTPGYAEEPEGEYKASNFEERPRVNNSPPRSILAPLILQPLLWAEPGTGLDVASKQAASERQATEIAKQKEFDETRFRGGTKAEHRARREERERLRDENREFERRRLLDAEGAFHSLSPSAEGKDSGAFDARDKPVVDASEDYVPFDFKADPEKAMRDSLVHAYKVQDRLQRPHTSGTPRQFHLFDNPEPAAVRYSLPNLDPSFTNVFANPWPAIPGGVAAQTGETFQPRAVSAGALDGPRRGRQRDSGTDRDGPSAHSMKANPSNLKKRTPSLESLGTITSLVHMMSTSMRENSLEAQTAIPYTPRSGRASTPTNIDKEIYLLDLLQGTRDKRRSSSREGSREGKRDRSRERDSPGEGGGKSQAHVGWSVIEASSMEASQTISGPAVSESKVSAEGSATTLQLQRILSQSAEVANAIMQRHTLELQMRQERAAAASLAVLDRRGLSSVALKKPPKLPSTGSLSKMTIDAANAITQAYLQSRAGLREYMASKSVLEDEYFLATAAQQGLGGTGSVTVSSDKAANGGVASLTGAHAGNNIFSEAVMLDSESNLRRRRELLGRVAEELGMVQADEKGTTGSGNNAKRTKKSQKFTADEQAAAGGGSVLPVLGYPSTYPVLQPVQDRVRKPGERFSRADRKGMKYTRTPEILPTADNPKQRPFGVKGGHYTIREFHPKYGLQAVPHPDEAYSVSLDGLSLASQQEILGVLGGGSFRIGEGSMQEDDATSSRSQGKSSRQRGTRNVIDLTDTTVCVSGVSVASAGSMASSRSLEGGSYDSTEIGHITSSRANRREEKTSSRSGERAASRGNSRSSERGVRSSPSKDNKAEKDQRNDDASAGLVLGALLDDEVDDDDATLGSARGSLSPEKSAISQVVVVKMKDNSL